MEELSDDEIGEKNKDKEHQAIEEDGNKCYGMLAQSKDDDFFVLLIFKPYIRFDTK